jgi:hypothetical protein
MKVLGLLQQIMAIITDSVALQAKLVTQNSFETGDYADGTWQLPHKRARANLALITEADVACATTVRTAARFPTSTTMPGST